MSSKWTLAWVTCALVALGGCKAMVSDPQTIAADATENRVCIDGPERNVEITELAANAQGVLIRWQVHYPCGQYTTTVRVGRDPASAHEYEVQNTTSASYPLLVRCGEAFFAQIVVQDSLGTMSTEEWLMSPDGCSSRRRPRPRERD